MDLDLRQHFESQTLGDFRCDLFPRWTKLQACWTGLGHLDNKNWNDVTRNINDLRHNLISIYSFCGTSGSWPAYPPSFAVTCVSHRETFGNASNNHPCTVIVPQFGSCCAMFLSHPGKSFLVTFPEVSLLAGVLKFAHGRLHLVLWPGWTVREGHEEREGERDSELPHLGPARKHRILHTGIFKAGGEHRLPPSQGFMLDLHLCLPVLASTGGSMGLRKFSQCKPPCFARCLTDKPFFLYGLIPICLQTFGLAPRSPF